MMDISAFIKTGLQNTLLFKNNLGTSHNGPWKQVYVDTLLDRWHMGSFSSAEYTISADLDTNNKEIIKVLVTATRDKASVVVYARNNTLRDLITVGAIINDSHVDIILNPATTSPADGNLGVKVIHTAQYFHNQNPLTP
jgi:hypothetical protein|tara:strand:+ start:8812 stop:9228 length:417 start_codon:yes stop_codon:yes gene_type:complete